MSLLRFDSAEDGGNAAAGEPPARRLLGNGRTTVLLTEEGTGFTRWGDLWLTPWSDDPVEDPEGFFVYLRDRRTGELVSAGAAPCSTPIDRRQTRAFWKAESFGTIREEQELEIVWEGRVPDQPDLDLRRLAVLNRSDAPRAIEAISCVEVALAPLASHRAHPCFSKLFVQTWFLPERGVLLARRRPRQAGESTPWVAHALIGGAVRGHETDRARLLGRGGTRARPRLAFEGTTGNVLDPVFSLRAEIDLEPGAAAQLFWALAAGDDREELLDRLALAAKPGTAEAIFGAAR